MLSVLVLDGSALGVSKLDVLTLDVSAPALDVSTLDVSAPMLDVSALDVSRLDVSALDVSESDVSMMYQCWVYPGWMYPQIHRDRMYHSLSNLKQRCITFHDWRSVGIHIRSISLLRPTLTNMLYEVKIKENKYKQTQLNTST